MISKPLFKQSCKATAILWTAITAATCFMLAIVIVVIGTSNADNIRNSMVRVFQDEAVYAETAKNAMTYYDQTATALEGYELQKANFDALLDSVTDFGYKTVTASYAQMIADGQSDETARAAIAAQSAPLGLTREHIDALIDYFLVNGTDLSDAAVSNYILDQVADAVYSQLQNEYDAETAEAAKKMMTDAIGKYLAQDDLDADTFAADYIAAMLADQMPDALAEEGLFYEADQIRAEAEAAIADFRGRMLLDPALDKTALIEELSESLLDQFPADVAQALEEIQDLDVFALIVGTVFFKSAGLILPIVYTIMTANNLIAGQVDSGSMAYVLSTPTKRKTVVRTQALFLAGSLLAMFACTTVTGLLCLAAVGSYAAVTITDTEMILLNLGAFITMFAISGICFLSSAWFNRSKQSMSYGGGLAMFFLVTVILGLFGSSVMPSAIRIDAMNLFNYVTIISLFDSPSIFGQTTTFLWKLAILAGIGIVCYGISVLRFQKKDLPL